MNRQDLEAAIAHPNTLAFLHAIRLGEGTADEDGYRRIVGGQLFDSFDCHPNIHVRLPRYNVVSSAAGAYQLIYPTWCGLVREYAFEDFSPTCQDLAAIALIAEKGALHFVIAGQLQEAVSRCAATWASLPGSTAGQRTEGFDKVQQCYLDHGGVLA